MPNHIRQSDGHDHGECLAESLERAEKSFKSKGLKMTPLRRRVLEEIAASHDAVGAYDVLDRLAKKTGDRLAPISVYRALDALLAAGVVHRLESRNAFFACHAPHEGRERHIALVCDQCAGVAEIDGERVHQAIATAVGATGFSARAAVVEVAGICRPCAAAPASAKGA